jgi:hypothetical protein
MNIRTSQTLIYGTDHSSIFSEQVETTVWYTVLRICTWGLAIQCTVRTTVLLYTIETVSYCDMT